jgi:hypothetical protein
VRRFARGVGIVAVTCATLAPAGQARAQDSGDVAAARDLGKRGTIAAQAGHCDEAVDLLNRAKALVPLPTVLTPLGECQLKLGHLVEGTENLQASANAQLGSNPQPALIKARDHAKELLPTALPRLAHLTINVHAPANAQPKLTDNGIVVSSVLVGVDHPVDPGKHTVEASAPGFLSQATSTSLGEGQAQTITLNLVVDPNARNLPPPPPLQTPDEHPDKTQLIAGIITMSVGGAALIAAGGLGGAALAKERSLSTLCGSMKKCPNANASDISTMKAMANASTGLFAVGGAAAGVGLIVTLTAPSGKSQPKPTGPQVRPVVGLGIAGVAGEF